MERQLKGHLCLWKAFMSSISTVFSCGTGLSENVMCTLEGLWFLCFPITLLREDWSAVTTWHLWKEHWSPKPSYKSHFKCFGGVTWCPTTIRNHTNIIKQPSIRQMHSSRKQGPYDSRSNVFVCLWWQFWLFCKNKICRKIDKSSVFTCIVHSAVCFQKLAAIDFFFK